MAGPAPKQNPSRVLRAVERRWTSECFSSSRATSPPKSRRNRPTERTADCTDFRTREQMQMSVLRAVITSVFCLALTGALFSPDAKADQWNRKTTLTFSGPVEIPGVHLKGWGVLPAGTYVFKLVESSSNRHIVQIFNKDETQIYATVLAIPNYRLKPTSKTVITFNEGIRGRPEAIRAWFYP